MTKESACDFLECGSLCARSYCILPTAKGNLLDLKEVLENNSN